MASLYNIHLRTGCFCNTGCCQKFLSLSNKQVKDNLSAGHVCGDDVDLIEGKPTGSVRISFGYMSNFVDAKTFLNFLEECFLDGDFHVTSSTQDSLHSDAMLTTESVLDKHFQHTVTPACPKQSASSDIHSSLEQDLAVYSTLEEKHYPETSVNAKMLYDCQVFKSQLPKSVPSLHHSGDLRLKKIFIYPIKSCAAFEVLILFMDNLPHWDLPLSCKHFKWIGSFPVPFGKNVCWLVVCWLFLGRGVLPIMASTIQYNVINSPQGVFQN